MAGRYYAQKRLDELRVDDKQGAATRGWLEQEKNRVLRAKENKNITLADGRTVTRTKGVTRITNPDGTPFTITNHNGKIEPYKRSDKAMHNPPGMELAHQRGLEAEKGHSYLFSDLKWKVDHRKQTDIDAAHRDHGKLNSTPAAVADYMRANPRGSLKRFVYEYEMEKREALRSSRSPATSSSSGGGGGGGGGQSLNQTLAQTSQRFQQAHNISYNQFESAPKPGAS